MHLEEVNTGVTTHRKRKRLGRGTGSGLGKTSGKGHNGHKSRSGYSRHPSFEGGQLPMIRRIPKRGFNNSYGANVFAVNVGRLCEVFAAGDEVTPVTLRERGLVKVVCDEIKILGNGDVDVDTLTYSIVDDTNANGTVSLNSAMGAYTYTPDANFNGTASFTFKVNDGTTDSNIATITFTVNAVRSEERRVGKECRSRCSPYH